MFRIPDMERVDFNPRKLLLPLRFDESLDPADDTELQAMLRVAGLVKWRNLGNAMYEPTDAEKGPEYEPQGEDPPAKFMIGMVTPRGHYMLEFDRDSMQHPDNPNMDPVPSITVEGSMTPRNHDKGWSSGTDSRTAYTGANVPQGVGRIGNCTGALIAPRIVRTAAHCIINHTIPPPGGQGGQAAASLPFNHREDSTTWGMQTTSTTLFYGINYISSGCGSRTASDYWAGYNANLDACGWADFGYLVLNTNWNNGVGYTAFGYRTMTAGDQWFVRRHGGYPDCSAPGAPASGCNVVGTYFEDRSLGCVIGPWLSSPSRWLSGCDISAAHSGGPIWQVSTHQLLGHIQYEHCVGAACGTDAYPNRALGHDSAIFNYQNWLNTTYP